MMSKERCFQSTNLTADLIRIRMPAGLWGSGTPRMLTMEIFVLRPVFYVMIRNKHLRQRPH
jgi:hypothetical protein